MSDRDLPEQIKDALDIVDIIGEVVPLQKKGANYFGLSPFKTEKTPSFCVNPANQFYFCFSTNQGGDIFSFVQKYYGWDFPQALEELAKRAGIEVQPKKQNLRQKESLAICEKACEFFESQLYESAAGEPARSYLKKRFIPESLWKDFRLGYHPGGYQVLAQVLESAGLSCELASQLGLLGRASSGAFVDRFRSRLMFPIADERGKIRGFGGRSLGNEEPKYLNSPASALFDKKRLLYGMHLASEACRKKDYAILCEGYLDVIALHEFGLKNSVGSMGTALTQEQLRTLKRRTHRVVSLYDADAAGLRATERNLEAFLQEGLSAKVAISAESKDIDALLHDPQLNETDKRKKLKEIFAKAQPALDYLVKTKVLVLSDPIERARAIRALVEVLDKVPDPVQKRVLKQEISKRFEIPLELLLGEEIAPSLGGASRPVLRSPPPRPRKGQTLWDREILRFLVKWGREEQFHLTELASYLSFSSKWSKLLLDLAQEGLSSSQIASLSWLDNQDEETRREVGQWLLEEQSGDSTFDLKLVWAGLAKKLRWQHFQAENQRIQDEIVKAEHSGNQESVRRLLNEKQDLVRYLKDED